MVVDEMCANAGGDANDNLTSALKKLLQLAPERLPRIPAWARLEEQLASTQQPAKVQRARDEFEVSVKNVRASPEGDFYKGILESVFRAWSGLVVVTSDAPDLVQGFRSSALPMLQDILVALERYGQEGDQADYHFAEEMVRAFGFNEQVRVARGLKQLRAAFEVPKKRKDFEAYEDVHPLALRARRPLLGIGARGRQQVLRRVLFHVCRGGVADERQGI